MRSVRRAKDGHSDPVALFLSRALAPGPLTVSELEAKARAAGLLGERQSLSDAKRFRAAKRRLAIRSIRTGFGRGGGWLWALSGERARVAEGTVNRSGGTPTSVIYEDTHSRPKQSDVVIPAPATSQPVEALRKPSIPLDWVHGVELLRRLARPSGVPQHRWQLFLDDCARFLDPSRGWAERAAKLGWDAEALFGCDRHRPLDQPGADLLWRVAGGRLIAIYKTWAVVESNGAQHIVHRRPATRGATRPWSLR